MKHIKTFESFLAENTEKLVWAHIDDTRRPGGTDKQIKKNYNLDVEDRDSEGFDVVGKKEDIEAFVDDYAIILADGIQDLVESKTKG